MSQYGFKDNWNQIIETVNALSNIDQKRKEELIDSVTTFRKTLGEGWLISVSQTNHPLLWSLRTISGSVSDLLLPFWANSISSLTKVDGFEKIITRIRNDESFESAITEVEIASRLAQRDCTITMEPNIDHKHPDLLCKYKDIEFLIEIKTARTAKETKKANKTSREIMSACNPLFPAGVIFKPLSTPHLTEIKSILQEKTNLALKNKSSIEVDIPKVLKLYLVSEQDPNRFQKYRDWHKKQESLGVLGKWYGGLAGPADGVKQEYRVKIRLDKLAKEKQIPPDMIGVVALVSDFYFWNVEDVSKFVDSIIESVYELTNIPAVILWSKKVISDGKTKITEKDDFIFIENYLFGEINENIVIVKNRFCKIKFDYDTLKNLLAFKN